MTCRVNYGEQQLHAGGATSLTTPQCKPQLVMSTPKQIYSDMENLRDPILLQSQCSNVCSNKKKLVYFHFFCSSSYAFYNNNVRIYIHGLALHYTVLILNVYVCSRVVVIIT